MAKIFLDPGHGGNDPGATGNGLKEKDINLAVANRVKYHLQRHGQTIVMSRTDDSNPSLQTRTNNANNWGADILVSIHCNAFNGNAYGVETYCYKFRYRKLADNIHGRVLADKSLYNYNRGVKEGNLHMIRESNMNAALIEMAFIDNTYDATLLKTKQEEFAVAISKGILDYFGLSYKEEVVAPPPTEEGVMYRVVTGSYSSRANAEAQVKKLKQAGFDSFIDIYNK